MSEDCKGILAAMGFGAFVAMWALLGFMSLCGTLPGDMQQEAVDKGHAEWVPMEKGRAKFEWLPPCEKCGKKEARE